MYSKEGFSRSPVLAHISCINLQILYCCGKFATKTVFALQRMYFSLGALIEQCRGISDLAVWPGVVDKTLVLVAALLSMRTVISSLLLCFIGRAGYRIKTGI